MFWREPARELCRPDYRDPRAKDTGGAILADLVSKRVAHRLGQCRRRRFGQSQLSAWVASRRNINALFNG